MTVPTNTRLTFSGVQIREDLSDIIYNISPMDTPFMSGAGRGTCSNTLFEWQKDELAAAAANQKLEGDDPASLAVVEPTKLTNQTQISEKAVQTSGTAEAVDWAGRKSAQAYQLAKRAKEIKRDMEKMMLGEDVKAAGAAGTAGTGVRSEVGPATCMSDEPVEYESGRSPRVGQTRALLRVVRELGGGRAERDESRKKREQRAQKSKKIET